MNPAAQSHGEGPKSTPVFAEGKLYTFGIGGILTCWDASSGAVRWRKEFSKQYRETSPLFGTAMSPVVDRGIVIAHAGGQQHSRDREASIASLRGTSSPWSKIGKPTCL